MDTKKIIVLGAMAVLGFVVFTQVKKMGTPVAVPETPVQTEVVVEKVKYVPVLAVASDFSVGQRIGESSLTSIEWPAEALTANLINLEDQPDAQAQFVNSLARVQLAEGETLTRDKVIMAGDSGIMAALLKPGMRAVTTRISVDTAAGGFIQPGDRVDVILRENFQIRRNPTLDAQSTTVGRNSLYVAKTLFENVKILAIDQTFTTSSETGAAIPGSTATFELSQSDAELLQESEGYGDIFLTLRGVNGSNYQARSAARVEREGQDPAPSTLTVYRDGQATPVALQQR
ncbi:Flp pilus assembly protein CpaB [Litorimonas sp. WD9-15]|uniref:Flp pilus assembly protein CpaB n=1 Tax=Litorimonas sp. WD9-15 TaxID=3418716 RepID=UPI003D087F5E